MKKISASILATVIISAVLLLLGDKLFAPDISRYHDLSPLIYDRNGKIIYAALSKDQQWRLPVKKLPLYYKDILVAYEDRRFDKHHGVDFLAIFRAALQNIKGGRIISGASTISMQNARLLMPHPRSYAYKLLEMLRAIQLERRYNKQQLLDIYATLAPMGGNIQGVEAASLIYFAQPAHKLSLAQSAFLVALPQSPRRALQNPRAARDKVLDIVYERGAITESDYRNALAEPLTLKKHAMPRFAPHYSERMLRQKQTHSSLDYNLQRQLEQELKQALTYRDSKSNLAAAIVDNASGAYLAYVGSAERSQQRQGYLDMLTAVRSPGSTLKPFIYLQAFEKFKYHSNTLIADTPLPGDYQPRNYDSEYKGNITLARALQTSRNIPAVRLLSEIGASQWATAIEAQGLQLFYPRNSIANLSFALGGVGVRGSDLIASYRKLALCSRGKKTTAKPIQASQRACAQTTLILQKSTRIKFGAAAVAVKTGTAYGWRDLWIIAYSDDYTWLLWAGRADGGYSVHRAAAEELLPIMQKIIAITPNAPQNYIPLKLQTAPFKLAKPLSKSYGTMQKNIAIQTPQDGSIIAYQPHLHINIRSIQGDAPYLWLINDEIIDENGASFSYPIKNTGVYKISVSDKSGQTANVSIRVMQINDDQNSVILTRDK